jgi:FkbM family methyltransferase
MGKNGVLHPTGYGIFEDSEILTQIADGAVLDVGASDGIESMMFAKLLPKSDSRIVYSFEPSSYNFTRLQQNISQSAFHNLISPQQIALGETD